jgi:hypothetical protein
MALSLQWWVAPVLAEDVGQFSRVVNQVEQLKQGKAPPLPAKVPNGVENQDQVKTREKSMAVVQFVDDSTMTISPKSKVTIEDYMYDASQAQSKGTIKVLQGVVESVIPTTDKLQKKDIKILTTTAIAGIRGTRLVTVANPEGADKPESTIFYVIPSEGVEPDKKKKVRIRTYAPDIMPEARTVQFMSERLEKKIPLEQTIDEGLKAGLDSCALVKAAVVLGVNVKQLVGAFQEVCTADPEYRKVCTPGTILTCTVKALRALKVAEVSEMQYVYVGQDWAPVVGEIKVTDLYFISNLSKTGIEGPIPYTSLSNEQMDQAKLTQEAQQVVIALLNAGVSITDLNDAMDDLGLPTGPDDLANIPAVSQQQISTGLGGGGTQELPQVSPFQ